MKLLHGKKDQRRGQALVEFALVIPLLFLLIFALVDFGRVIYTQNAISQGAREGARWGSVQARSASDIPGIEEYTVEALAGLSAGGVNVEATCIRPGSVVMPCHADDTLEVHVETTVELATPLIAQLMQAIGANPIDLSATSQVVVNN